MRLTVWLLALPLWHTRDMRNLEDPSSHRHARG